MTAEHQSQGSEAFVQVTDAFLAELVQELDCADIVGITLGGSYARGEATRYSDLDFACFWREGVKPPPKSFFYRQGRLISVKKTSVSELRSMLNRPEAALLFARGKHRLLLDKDGSVGQFLREIEDFRWEKLRPVAEAQNGFWLMLVAEEIHKILREFQQENEAGLVYAVAKLISELTLVAALAMGVLIISDSTYYEQVEEAAGPDSAWTRYHRLALGLAEGPASIKPLRARGLAALFLYRETLPLVRPAMQPEQLAVVEEALRIVSASIDKLPFSLEERRWLAEWKA
jgi:hypothetical protein